MTMLLSPDISNWDSPTAENSGACLATSATGPPVIRASIESPRLAEIAVAQFDAIEKAGRSTMAYDWASSALGPEANAQATVNLIHGHCSTKRIWADVEDYGSFQSFPPNLVPKRMLATLLARGFSPAMMNANQAGKVALSETSLNSLKAITLASLAPTEAVAWLRAWVKEIHTLGYIPGFYSAPGVWNQLCGGDRSFPDVDGWGAVWGGTQPIVVPPIAWGGITNWCGVQYLPGGTDLTMCNMSLDLNAWDSDKLGVEPPVVVQPEPPAIPDGGPYATVADLAHFNTDIVWRLTGIKAGLEAILPFLDPNNVP